MGIPLRVLIIEDAEDDARLIVRQLRHGGYEPAHERVDTENGMAQALDKGTWDVIISDYRMPQFAGLAALKLYKGKGLDIPFIIVSGTIGEDIAVEAMKAGAHDYVMKGNLSRLVPAIERELRDATMRRENREVAEALKASEKRYRDFADSLPQTVVEFDQTGHFTYVNRNSSKTFGYTRSDFEKGLNVYQMIIPEDHGKAKESVRKALEGDNSHGNEYTAVRKDGGTFPMVVYTSSVVRGDKLPCVRAIIVDITYLKKSEDALRESENRLRTLVEHLSSGVAIYRAVSNGADFVCMDFNKGGENIDHITREQVIGRSLLETFPWVKKLGMFDVLQRVYRTGEPERFPMTLYEDGKNSSWRENYVYRLPSGEVVAVYEDVTDRKQAETKLKESEEQYRIAIEHSNDGVVLMKGDEHIYVNQRFLEIHGYEKPEDVIGKLPSLVVHADDRERVVEYVRNRKRGGSAPVRYEYKGIRKDGTTILVEASVANTVYRGEMATLAYLRDITGSKHAEEELRQATERLRKSLVGTIQAMSLLVETRDPYTAGHQRRVSTLARAIAQNMGLSKDIIDTIRMAGTIHDIGKMSVPAEILSKPTKLTDIEFSLIKIHPRTGYDILKDVELPAPIAEIVLQHHERLDGSGYPQGLKGDQILLEARIIAVADVIEAIASDRPYRAAPGIGVALGEIEKNKGVLYDAEVVDVCLKLFRDTGFCFDQKQDRTDEVNGTHAVDSSRSAADVF